MWEKVAELEGIEGQGDGDGAEGVGAEGAERGAPLRAQLLERVLAASAERVLEYRELEIAHTQGSNSDAAKAPRI